MIDVAITTLLRRAAPGARDVVPSTAVVKVTDRELPLIAYTRVGGERPYNHDGRVGLGFARYQLDVFAVSLAATLETMKTLRGPPTATPPGLDGFRGGVGDVQILRIHFPSLERFEHTPVRDGENRAVVRLSQDMNVSYREP